MSRRVERYPSPCPGNSMRCWRRVRSFGRVALHFAVITLARYLPWLELKNVLYRLIGVKVGRGVSFGLAVMLDIFFPERIRVGDGSLIGYNTVILTHEFLLDEWRVGDVEIGSRVVIGANCTILPGVRIGDGAVVAAHSLVNRDIPPGVLAGGVPARVLGPARPGGAAARHEGDPAGAGGAPERPGRPCVIPPAPAHSMGTPACEEDGT